MKPGIFLLVAMAAIQTIGVFTSRAANLATVSAAGPASVSAGGNSLGPTISGDGRRVAFVSHAGNLVTNETLHGSLQVFVRDLVASNAVLVSVSTNGRGGDANSFGPMISSNGQFVVFASEAGNLVIGDTNGANDVFVRDLTSGITRLVSTDLSERSPVDDKINSITPLSGNPLISADGQWVFFESRATNLTAVADTNGATDVFARNIQTNLTVVVSLNATGARTADGSSTLAGISADGRYVGFISTATNIAAGGTNAAGDLYRRDIMTGDRQCASKNVGSLVPGSYQCVNAALSANGRYVAFATAGTSNAVFRHDFDSNLTALVSLRVTNAESVVSISADGRYVSFDDGTNVFRFDANTGANALVNVTTTGAPPFSGIARNPVATPDGNGIVFISNCPDLVTNSSTLFQIYARDMAAGTTRLITVATNGQPSATNNEVSLLTVAPDFSRVAFDSSAADLVESDGNRASDVFIRQLVAQTTSLVSRRDALRPRTSGVAHTFVESDCVSADGRFVVFSSFDNDLLPGDSNAKPDLFVRDMMTGALTTPGFSTNVARYSAISANGRYVVYLRRKPNHPFDIGGGTVFRFDRETGTNELVSSSSRSAPSTKCAISPDGNLIAFRSGGNLFLRDMIHGTNLTVGPAENTRFDGSVDADAIFTPDGRFLLFKSGQLFAYDLSSNRTHLVSAVGVGYDGTSLGISGNSRFVVFSPGTIHDLVSETNGLLYSGRFATVSADGRFVAFNGDSNAPDPAFRNQIVVQDRQSGSLELVSVSTTGAPALSQAGRRPMISGDGRFVVFGALASNLVTNDANLLGDVFVRDRLLGTTILISRNTEGVAGNAASAVQPVMAADGRTVVFHSMASDLVEGDYNDKRDIFVLKLGGADTDGDGMDDDWEVAYFGNLSRSGSGDFDSDGQTDLQEFLAGTDPTNSGSVFRVLTVRPVGGGSTQVIWAGNPSRTYRVEFKDDVGATNWTTVAGTLSWNGSAASLTDTSTTNSGHRYYRAVRLP